MGPCIGLIVSLHTHAAAGYNSTIHVHVTVSKSSPPLPAPPMLSHLREYVYKIINRCEPHIYPLILPVSCIYCTSTLTSAPRVNMSSFICTVGPVLGTLPPLIRIRTQEYDSVSPERWDLRRELFLSVIYSTACIM